uniref:Putative product n=1 Tax=Xenopsylla cheopis TaxID=163159 RepID=A0A6M2DY16_XENCH
MLLAVLLLFLITEFPQGILGLLSAVLGNTFFTECYLKLGEVMDIFALINSAINFILYCAMSRQFRLTFREAFCKMLSKAGIPDRRNVRGAVSGNGVPDQDKTTQRLVRHGTLKHETQVTQV